MNTRVLFTTQRFRLRAFIVVTILALLLSGWSGPALSSRPALADESVPLLYASAPNAPDAQLQAIVEGVVADLPGDWGVAIKKLDTGQYAVYNGDKQQVSASLYKLWVLGELFRQIEAGIISLDDTETISDDDANYGASLGESRFNSGDDVTVRHAAELMVQLSDNTAAHLLVRTLGPDNINRFMRQIGLNNSVLDETGVGDNLTTPLDIMHELELIETSHLVDAAASKGMVDLLLGQQINNLLPPGMPDNTPFAHKTGALDNLLHDAGIVYSPAGPYLIVVMTSNLDDYGTAWTNMPVLARKVYDYFTARPSSPALYFPQTRQVVGHDFLKFWNTFGGLPVFGYPIGPEHIENGVTVQQFERARFEWHSDSAQAAELEPQVVLGPIGSERAATLGLSWPRSPDAGTGQYFDQTGQGVSGEFLDFWLSNGGQRVFGYPISPAQDMTSPVDGKTYMTQWFQQARMEIHPDLPPGNRVVLSTLGSEMAASR